MSRAKGSLGKERPSRILPPGNTAQGWTERGACRTLFSATAAGAAGWPSSRHEPVPCGLPVADSAAQCAVTSAHNDLQVPSTPATSTWMVGQLPSRPPTLGGSWPRSSRQRCQVMGLMWPGRRGAAGPGPQTCPRQRCSPRLGTQPQRLEASVTSVQINIWGS